MTKGGLTKSRSHSKNANKTAKQNMPNSFEGGNLNNAKQDDMKLDPRQRSKPRNANDTTENKESSKKVKPAHSHRLPPPPPPPAPPVPPQTQTYSKLNQLEEQVVSSPSHANNMLKKQKLKFHNMQQMPPTPPPLPTPPFSSGSKLLSSTPQNPNQIQIPASYMMSPSPTPTLRVSKSVDAPRLNININKDDASTPTNKSEFFQKIIKKFLFFPNFRGFLIPI